MNVAIRADASVEIGSGHVMRCLALADELTRHGSRVHFICGRLPEVSAQLVLDHGHRVHRIEPVDGAWQDDARQVAAQMGGDGPWDWLIVDHYGLDARWETSLSGTAHRVMAIDDLADRAHNCDVVLDQNVRQPMRYASLVAPNTELLLGPEFALMPPAFGALRANALGRRTGDLRRILVFMGGGDSGNETGKVVAGLIRLLRHDLTVDVVVGANHPKVDQIGHACRFLPGAAFHVQTDRMAELTLQADLAIGGGGGATWERCVLGLPALVTLMAENQRDVAARLEAEGAQQVLGWCRDLTPDDYANAVRNVRPASLVEMSERAAALCDGQGVSRVADRLIELRTQERVHA